jgi:coenzyme PQQ synthesis protein D (PqqD)
MRTVRLRQGAVEWRAVEDQVMALDLQASQYFAVNRSGAAIWPLLDKGATPAELTERLVTEYGIDRASAERDVEEFLTILTGRDLLDTDNATSA